MCFYVHRDIPYASENTAGAWHKECDDTCREGFKVVRPIPRFRGSKSLWDTEWRAESLSLCQKIQVDVKRPDKPFRLSVLLKCGILLDWILQELPDGVGMEARRVERDPGRAGNNRRGLREATA